MANTVLPADVEAIVPSPASSICAAFVKVFLRMPVLFFKWITYQHAADGTCTDGFKKDCNWIRTGDLIFSAAPDSDGDGRLLCDGTAKPQATYPDLYAVIGDLYTPVGVTPAAGMFYVPNYNARFPMGTSGVYSLGASGGASNVTLAAGNLPEHPHGSIFSRGTATAVAPDAAGTIALFDDETFVPHAPLEVPTEYEANPEDPPTAVQIRNPYVACYIYIKT